MHAGAHALPFEAGGGAANELMTKFNVRGIPTLLVFDASGKLVTETGREKLVADPQGRSFPWR